MTIDELDSVLDRVREAKARHAAQPPAEKPQTTLTKPAVKDGEVEEEFDDDTTEEEDLTTALLLLEEARDLLDVFADQHSIVTWQQRNESRKAALDMTVFLNQYEPT